MSPEYRLIVDGSFFCQMSKGLFDTGFEREMFRFLYFSRVFQLERIAKVAFSFEIAEGVERHALSCFFECLFS